MAEIGSRNEQKAALAVGTAKAKTSKPKRMVEALKRGYLFCIIIYTLLAGLNLALSQL